MTKFTVPEMSCGHCTAAIETGIRSADTAASVSCDLASRTVSVISTLPTEALLAVFKQAGYDAALA